MMGGKKKKAGEIGEECGLKGQIIWVWPASVFAAEWKQNTLQAAMCETDPIEWVRIHSLLVAQFHSAIVSTLRSFHSVPVRGTMKINTTGVEFFGLTKVEMEHLRVHFQSFGIVRRCCGMQMSKYEVLRLNGCNVKAHSSKPDYPHCEIYNLTAIEEQFAVSPIPFHEDEPGMLWTQPGDCQRFRDKVRSGRGFNDLPVTSCKINGPHGTVGDWSKASQGPPKANSKTVPAKEVENEAVLKNLQDRGHRLAVAVNMAGA